MSIREQVLDSFNKQNARPGIHQGERKIKKGIPNKRVVLFPSLLNNLLMPCESRLEAFSCLNLEFDDEVAKYQTQPITIHFDQNKRYTPDFAILKKTGEIIIREVKVSAKLKNLKLIERLEKIQTIFNYEGFKFEVITEKELTNQPNLKNKQFLYKSRRIKFSTYETNAALKLISNFTGQFTLGEARNLCTKNSLSPLIADHLIAQNILHFDPQTILSTTTLITSSKENDYE